VCKALESVFYLINTGGSLAQERFMLLFLNKLTFAGLPSFLLDKQEYCDYYPKS
jgi:hypothetical protein